MILFVETVSQETAQGKYNFMCMHVQALLVSLLQYRE